MTILKKKSPSIKDILLAGNYVSKEDIKKAEEFTKKHNASIKDYLLSQELLSKDLFGQAMSEFYKVPYSDLNSNQPSKDQILKIPKEFAIKHRVVLFFEDAKKAIIATDNPEQKNLDASLKKLFKKKKINITYSLSEDIDDLFVNYRKSLETRFSKIIKKQTRVAPEIIEEIIEDAIIFKASDIHFEPQSEDVIIRFRIDGVLHEAGRILKEYYENILNRIKIQAHLRLDEHFAAQDGAIRHIRKNKGSADLRISIIPTLDGEKITIRLLGEYVKGFTLNDIGLSFHNQKVFTKSINRPFGMIIVVGPTGSGKTTTLYSFIKILNQPGVNITTIEDPVEYKIGGINQIQVNPRTNLTFAKGLRSIVRQDPDIVLVGEIRDRETAEIGVNAALTGHLLLSTFHANDAATAIPRLLDMGIEPFLLSSTLEVVIAQRLVRKICEECRCSYEEKLSNIQTVFPGAKKYFKKSKITLYKGKGCDGCNGTGYKGRTAIFEFIRNTKELQTLILKNPSTQQIWQLAKTQGSIGLFEDGLEKVKNGITTLEELTRIAEPNKN